MANKRIIELQERTSIDMGDWLIVDNSTSTRKLSLATLFNYMTLTSMIFVTELPTTDISESTIYLVPHSGSTTDWDEYIYRDNEWVQIGTSTIDLSAIYQTVANATAQNQDIPWYGTCSTAAGTTDKVATTADTKLGALAAGQKVKIKFTNANTASAPTLNVDSKGAASIKAYNTTAPTVWWKAGDTVEFTYDGTNWIMSPTQGQIEDIKSALTYKDVMSVRVVTNNNDYTISDLSNFNEIEVVFIVETAADVFRKCVMHLCKSEFAIGEGSSNIIQSMTEIESGTTYNAAVQYYFKNNTTLHIHAMPTTGWTPITYIMRIRGR